MNCSTSLPVVNTYLLSLLCRTAACLLLIEGGASVSIQKVVAEEAVLSKKTAAQAWDALADRYAKDAADEYAKTADENWEVFLQKYLSRKSIKKDLAEAVRYKFRELAVHEAAIAELKQLGVPVENAHSDPQVKELIEAKVAETSRAVEAENSSSGGTGKPSNPMVVTQGGSPADTLKGLGFGVGFSLTADIGKHNRVKGASKDSEKKVRVDSEQDVLPRFVLESHYFFPGPRGFLGVPKENWGWGPFVAVEPGGDSLVNSVGAGLLVGWKRKNDSQSRSPVDSFNLGIGVSVDPSTQILGDGIIEGSVYEGEIRYKETHQIGIMGIFSAAF